jgi:glutathione S-transferase
LRWNEHSEKALASGRALVSMRVLEDPAAKCEALPPAIPSSIHRLMTPLANVAVSYLRNKYQYGGGASAAEAHRQSYQQVLESLAAALADGRRFLLGDRFSYADVCMAVSLQCVRPVTDEFIKLGPATRAAWTDEELARRFPALLDWRDQIYESQR